tara:strand:+ start:4229 stop:4390 length:162 start_codon:yes stop_codon:yes gene_type:complete
MVIKAIKNKDDKITFSKGKGSFTIKLGEMFKTDKSKQSSLKDYLKKQNGCVTN